MLNDIQKWQIEQLASNGGFSDHFISSYVYRTARENLTDEQVSSVRSHRRSVKVLLKTWRNGLSSISASHAKKATSGRSAQTKKKKSA